MQRFSASRSAVPRVTGNPPSDDSSQADAGYFHSVSLPMYRRRRVVITETIGVSMYERCTGATMNAPDRGTFSSPSTRIRSQMRQKPTHSRRANR